MIGMKITSRYQSQRFVLLWLIRLVENSTYGCVRQVVSQKIQVTIYKEHGRGSSAAEKELFVTRSFSQRNLNLPLRCCCAEQCVGFL